ncbi:Ras-related protein Rab-24 [Balamuthia mandrillaris]
MAKVDAKVVLLGMHNVGKTCLVDRYLHGRFTEDVTATVGAAFGAKKVSVGEEELTLGIWDTAGAERYESMSRIYYRGARAALVCFDLTKGDTWAKVRFWVNELIANEKDCALYIVGTKLDCIEDGSETRKVRPEAVKEYASNIGARLFETSARTGQNVDELFQTVAEDFLQRTRSVPALVNLTPSAPPLELGAAAGGQPGSSSNCSC